MLFRSNALAGASDILLSSTCVYAADATLLQGQYPFLHQTYAGMYDLLNYMASLRATALFFKKEYQSYLFIGRTGSDTNLNLSQWLTLRMPQDINSTMSLINSDVANSTTLSQMAALLTNTVYTNRTQRLSFLTSLINTNYLFAGGLGTNMAPHSQASYKVTCNYDSQSYLIVQTAGQIPTWTDSSQKGAVAQPAYSLYTADGRYQLANVASDINNLFHMDLAHNPLAFLRRLPQKFLRGS